MSERNLPLKFGSGCIICKDIEVKGDVTVGSGTVIHPRARIIAEAGPIIIGDKNLIEERALIWNKPRDDSAGSTPVMIIGNLNSFEVDSQCLARKVGDNNIIEVKAVVGREVVLTDGCMVGAGCVLQGSETIPSNTVVYGAQCLRRNTQGHQNPVLQIETLSKLLPPFNPIVK